MNDLPEPKRDTLAHPPLELVVSQIRHEPHASITDASLVLELQQAIGDGFTRLEPANSSEISLDPRSVSVQAKPAWRLATGDGKWIITLGIDSFSLEATRYTTWTEFRRRFMRIVHQVELKLGPKLVQRIGLRYVDRITADHLGKPSEWVGYLNPAFLGLAHGSAIGESLVTVQTIHEMHVDDAFAVIRGSCASDQTPSGYSMLLDTDCSTQSAQAFNSETIQASLEKLHSLNLQLFQSAMTDKLYEELKS